MPELNEPWPVHEIVYTAIVGLVMLAACLEWFLWVAAFMYCLVKVYQKAEHWTIRLLAVIVGTAFLLLRSIFMPIMIVTLPLPSQVVKLWPPAMVDFLQWFAFWSFAGLLTVPWLFCVYQIVTHQLGRTKRIKQVLDEVSAPKVVIVMPCYKEEPDVLLGAIDSVVDCDYPPSCIHVFLSFDGDQVDELYLNTIERLGVPLTLTDYPTSIDVAYKGARITISRFPHGGKRNCQKSTFKLIDKVYMQYLKRNDNLFILFIDSDCILDRVCLQNFVYDMELSPGNSRNMLAMTGVITSTTQKHSLITLLQDMEYIHGQLFERTVESGCGAVTCLPGALTMLRFSAFRRMAKYYFADKAEQCEDLFDFAKGHLGEDRYLTHLFMIGAKQRYQIQMCTSAFCKTEAVQTVRSLIKQRRRWFLGFITNEVCMLTDWRLWKRYPVLVLVRFMQNTIRTTALLFFIMVLAIMTTSKRVDDLPVGFIAISLGLNWAMMVYFGWKLKRFKIWLYPLMFILNPFFNWYYMVYGIFTAGQRTWGGPRADAAAADGETTAQEAIEAAEEKGDDLNIVPESFIPAADIQRKKSNKAAGDGEAQAGQEGSDDVVSSGDSDAGQGHTHQPTSETEPLESVRQHVLPPDAVDGMFAAPVRTASGWYQHPDDSMVNESMASLAFGSYAPHPAQAYNHHGSYYYDSKPRRSRGSDPHNDPNAHPLLLLHARNSDDSFVSSGQQTAADARGGTTFYNAGNDSYRDDVHNSIYLQQPRPKASSAAVSFMSEEDRRKFEMASSASSQLNMFSASRGQQQSSAAASQAGYTDEVELPRSTRAEQRRMASEESMGSRVSSQSQILDHHAPAAVATGGGRNGRSPLARASFVRSTTMDGVEGEIERSHGGRRRDGPGGHGSGSGSAREHSPPPRSPGHKKQR